MEGTREGEFEPEEAFADEVRRAVPDPARAEDAVAAVLCSLARRMTPDGARDVAGRLPLRLRRLVAACPLHRDAVAGRGGDLVHDVAAHLGVPPGEAADVARAVLHAARRLAGGSAAEVERALPPDVRRLWRGEEDGR